jgi:alkylation response protein AidB-like acyl-CoA dehydrogenase
MTSTAERLLANIRELAPAITARAADIEAARRIPLDLVDALRSIGVFRMFVPESHGGLELDLPAALEVFEALARIDGSLGWTATIGSGCDVFAALLPRLAGKRTVAVRQWLPACRLAVRVLHYDRWRQASTRAGR